MTFLSPESVQPWLEKTKLTLSVIDPFLETYVKDQTLSRLSNRYDTTTWTTYSTTPSIVIQAMSLLYASFYYQKMYSEDISPLDASWGAKLESMWASLVAGLADGSVDIIGVDEALITSGSPDFYPTDTQEEDGLGEERQFTMGKVF